jgi:phosphoribosylaminoimidazolecarboxamide formyltransferase/IMP cyclohydrolase
MNMLPIRRAILSVTDKSGLEDFARFLQEQGVELVSTGGTRKKLVQAGLKVRSVSDVTGFPEILGGRVKTLHPHVHAGILADKDDPAHMRTLKDLRLAPFDLICVNLYNFAEAVRQTLEDKQAVEQIDIGGPTMLRASAKNFHSVAVIPDPSHYAECMKEMQENGGSLSLAFRKRMAVSTFALTSEYDRMITEYLSRS